MELGPAEIAGLVAGMGLALSVINKLVDALIAKLNRKEGSGPPTNGAMKEVVQALRDVAAGQREVVSKLDVLCEVTKDVKVELRSHDDRSQRRFADLYARYRSMEREG